MTGPLKILINAELIPGGHTGGTEQFLMGLVYALGRLDGPEEYAVIGHYQNLNWLEPYLGPNQKILPDWGRFPGVKRLLGPLRRPAGEIWWWVHRVLSANGSSRVFTLPVSNGFYESLHADVIHFPFQSFTRCELPSVFNPWDLQHIHFPQFFSQEQILRREVIYRGACSYARAVVAASQAVKDDLVRSYKLDPERVFVIRTGVPSAMYDPPTEQMLREVDRKYRLPKFFAFYPAQTWQHKNHLRLLEAIHGLRKHRGVLLNLVCTGRKNDFWLTIENRLNELGLNGQVSFLGYVAPKELRALYRLSQFVVFPSLFEGAGLPVLEAFQETAPVACSAIPPLQEYGGDAVLQFDPTCVESIARALQQISSDEKLRARLRMRGTERVRLFTWERTGRMYRALYRKVAGRMLSQEDWQLLGEQRLSVGAGERNRGANKVEGPAI